MLHIEERDISSKELLDALDALAAHYEILQYYTKEELEIMQNNLRETQGQLYADRTNAQITD